MPKFFVKTNQISNNKIQILGEDVKHITQVLRAKKGEKLNICNVDNGTDYLAEIEELTKQEVLCNIIEQIENSSESKVQITIFQGLPKADKMEYIIQKNTELGVKKFTPVIMKRCVAKLEPKDINKKIQRWQKIAEAAAKQSGRNIIPTVEKPITVEELSKKVNEFDVLILAYENEKNNTLKAELKNINIENLKIGVIIGPEGGLDINEVNILVESGAKAVSLGKRILRTETASIMIISNIIYEYE